MYTFKKFLPFLVVILIGITTATGYYSAKKVSAQLQKNENLLYIPLVGISSLPVPLALPAGPGNVTYRYAVKNFLAEYPLENVAVTDDTCNPVKFIEGDDNKDSELDYNETWRYSCTMKLSKTTQSIATVVGTANNLLATHKAYATVVVGSDSPYPLVNIINISKVAYPLALPKEGGVVSFTYRVNNPGVVALSNVVVVDDKCQAMSSKLGDTNGNNLLDTTEVWTYTCATHLTKTTTNTVGVTAFAGGFKAVGYATITVTVETIPGLPNAGGGQHFKIIIWEALSGVLIVLIISYILIRRAANQKKVS